MVSGGGASFLRAAGTVALLSFLQASVVEAQGYSDGDGEESRVVVGYVRHGLGLRTIDGSWGEVPVPENVEPLSVQRWDGIVRQELDAGCGPASLATIYTHYLDLPVSEKDLLRALTAETLRRGGSPEDIRRRGYSFGDLKRIAERSGLVTAAFRADLAQLRELRIPVVTRIVIRGYQHFVVLKGVVGDRVALADPSFGNMTMPLGQFGKIWSGIMLAVGRPTGARSENGIEAIGRPGVAEIDYSSFRRGPRLPEIPTYQWIFAAERVALGVDFPLGGFEDFQLYSVGRTELRYNLD
jgi:predicted double-glycine peptidase